MHKFGAATNNKTWMVLHFKACHYKRPSQFLESTLYERDVSMTSLKIEVTDVI